MPTSTDAYQLDGVALSLTDIALTGLTFGAGDGNPGADVTVAPAGHCPLGSRVLAAFSLTKAAAGGPFVCYTPGVDYEAIAGTASGLAARIRDLGAGGGAATQVIIFLLAPAL